MDPIVLSPKYSLLQSEIHFGLNQLIASCQSKPGVIVVDEALGKTHGVLIQKMLGYELIEIPNEKTRQAKEKLEDQLFKKNTDKSSILIGVGGGNVTDLVAFSASTYMRGIPLILVPTTLLAMVDAAIGGKTAIDTPFGKNLIGTFYLPQALFIDPDFLKTLPPVELKNGLSEILKYGLVLDPSIWNKAGNWQQHLKELIHASVLCKCHVVEKDFEEKLGFRRILNFGHTVGHGLENLFNYKIAHGEAVAIGCMAESYLSHLLGYLPEDSLETILTLYRKLGYVFRKLNPRSLTQAMRLDKKAKEGRIRFVLIDQIGHAIPFDGEYCREVGESEVNQMIEWMNRELC